MICFRRSFSGTTPGWNKTQHDFTSTPDNDPVVHLLENPTWGADTTQGITDNNHNDDGNNYDDTGNNYDDTENNYNNGNNYSSTHDNNANDNSNATFPNGENIFVEIMGINLQNLFDETTNNDSHLSPSIDGQHFHTIPVGGNILVEGVDREPYYYETTHQNNNSEATPDSHIASVIQGSTDGGIPFFVEELEIHSGGEPFSDANQVCTDGSVPSTQPARAPFKRPAPAPKDSEASSESSPKKTRETRDAPYIESEAPLGRPPPEAPPATNTGSSPNKTTDTDDENSGTRTRPNDHTERRQEGPSKQRRKMHHLQDEAEV